MVEEDDLRSKLFVKLTIRDIKNNYALLETDLNMYYTMDMWSKYS